MSCETCPLREQSDPYTHQTVPPAAYRPAPPPAHNAWETPLPSSGPRQPSAGTVSESSPAPAVPDGGPLVSASAADLSSSILLSLQKEIANLSVVLAQVSVRLTAVEARPVPPAPCPPPGPAPVTADAGGSSSLPLSPAADPQPQATASTPLSSVPPVQATGTHVASHTSGSGAQIVGDSGLTAIYSRLDSLETSVAGIHTTMQAILARMDGTQQQPLDISLTS